MYQMITPDYARLMMGLAFFPLGLFAIAAGMIMLIAGPYRKEAKLLAAQSARIGSLRPSADAKGFTESIADLTRSATALIDAVNNLIRTSSGNAVVLIGVGSLFEAAAYWLLVAGA